MSYIWGQMSNMESKYKDFDKDEIADFVSEAIVDYVYTKKPVPLEKVYGGKSATKDILKDKMFVISAIRSGLPYQIYEMVREISPFSELEWADYLDLSTKSLQRYKQEKDYKFKAIHSEKILEIAEVVTLGLEVFEDKSKFDLWLHTPSMALGGYEPLELIKDSYGKELVIAELTRIEHGIFV